METVGSISGSTDRLRSVRVGRRDDWSPAFGERIGLPSHAKPSRCICGSQRRWPKKTRTFSVRALRNTSLTLSNRNALKKSSKPSWRASVARARQVRMLTSQLSGATVTSPSRKTAACFSNVSTETTRYGAKAFTEVSPMPFGAFWCALVNSPDVPIDTTSFSRGIPISYRFYTDFRVPRNCTE